MKIVVASQDFPVWEGGVAVWAHKLARFLSQSGQTVHVLTPRQLPQDAGFDQGQPYAITRIWNLKDHHLKYWYSLFAARRLLQREKPDWYLCTTWYPFANALAGCQNRPPGIILAHGNDFLERRWQKPYWRRRMHAAFHQATWIIPVSQPVQEALLALDPSWAPKMRILNPAVDVGDFPARAVPPAHPPILLSIGRLVERKGFDKVILALPKVLQRHPSLEYWLAGRGAYRGELERLVQQLGLEQKVRFLGFVSQAEKLQLYQQAFAYIMPSRTIASRGDFEGFGITFLEANACFRPVIGSSAGGVAEAVTDGFNGLWAQPEDPDDIAGKILSLLEHPERAAEMGHNGRQRVETKFNWEVVTNKLLNLIAHERTSH
jgi:phosphatidylinositol alpha-1,6-mannosyltransferase